MFQTIAIHGRQPALGRAELESLHGADALVPFGDQASLLTVESSTVDFSRLGGCIRLARILNELPNTWSEIEKYLVSKTPEHAEFIDGKLSFGISVFGLSVAPKKIASTALSVKKAIKKSGHSVRMVPHTTTELNSASVLHNKLTHKNGWELLIVSDGKKTYLAQTTHIQDIDAYAARDQARPHRDAKVGMLPPKLAQIIINLGVGQPKNDKQTLILDPFCGTGVVLQEAMLMDYDIYGTDLVPRMIQYSIDNLTWLDQRYPHTGDYRRIEVGDATTATWSFDARDWNIVVAGETYLGQPLTNLPPSDHLSKIMHEVNQLHHKFLRNLSAQIPSGTRICLAIPTWRGRKEFLHLSALDYLEDLGYTRKSFTHVADEDLIYHREGQVVGRELLVLQKR